jgi:MYXO-CTERM domain-containing protein
MRHTDFALVVALAVVVGLGLAWLLPAFDGWASSIVAAFVAVVVMALLARRRRRLGHL